MNHLLPRFNTTPVTVVENGGDRSRRFTSASYPTCPHCGRFGALISGHSYTLIHRTHCVIAEGLEAQRELDSVRFQADDQLTEFARAYSGFERLDAEIRGEFLPPGATTVIHRETVLAG